MFVNHQHIDGTYSHGLESEEASMQEKQSHKLCYLKNKQKFHHAERKAAWEKNLTFLIMEDRSLVWCNPWSCRLDETVTEQQKQQF